MNPRLSSSKKWTALPLELCEQVQEVCIESFPSLAKKGKFIVEGRIYPEELCVRIGYLEKGRLSQANFEVSVDFNAKKQNALQMIHFSIDCAASMLQDYVAVEEDLQEFPRTWKSFDVEGKKVFLQVSTVNTGLEAEADKLLGVTEEDLVRGDDEEEDLKAKITMLGLDEDEDFTDEETATAASAQPELDEDLEGSDNLEDDESDDSDDDGDPGPNGYKH